MPLAAQDYQPASCAAQRKQTPGQSFALYGERNQFMSRA